MRLPKAFIVAILATLSMSGSYAHEAVEVTLKDRLTRFIEDTYGASHASIIVESVLKASKANDIEPALILGIIKVESNFKPNARNQSGATGLMQVLLPMHNHRFDNPKRAVALAKDPENNIEVGTEILSEFLNKHNGNTRKALISYSGGATNYYQKVYREKIKFEKVINNELTYSGPTI
jgi:soluble lytic murein transglycosylase-like protein